MSEFDDVREFRKKFGMFIFDRPTHIKTNKLVERFRFLSEEMLELSQAIEVQDLAEIADALIDLVYVAMGTAAMMGLPWKDLWDDVHRANLNKVRGVGRRGNLVDVIKPPGWVGPQGEKILNCLGYDRQNFLTPDGRIDETLCYSDENETLK